MVHYWCTDKVFKQNMDRFHDKNVGWKCYMVQDI